MSQDQLPANKKKCFIAVMYYRQTNGKSWQTVEEVEVTTHLKDNHYTGASVIIDVMNQKFIKNRFKEDTKFSEEDHMIYLANYIEKYKFQIEQVLKK